MSKELHILKYLKESMDSNAIKYDPATHMYNGVYLKPGDIVVDRKVGSEYRVDAIDVNVPTTLVLQELNSDDQPTENAPVTVSVDPSSTNPLYRELFLFGTSPNNRF